MKIAFVGEVFSVQRYGGISRYFIELARAISSSKEAEIFFRSPVYVNTYLRAHARELKHRGLYIPFSGRGIHELSEFVSKRMFGMSKNRSPDVVHDTYYSPDLLERMSGRKTATFYDMIYERFDPNRELREKKQRTATLCNHCIAISESTKSDMVHFLDIHPDKISVVHLAANLFEPQETSRIKSWVSASSRPYVLWVGPRAWYKNFEGFLKAFALTRAQSQRFRIVCAGGSPPRANEKEKWSNLGVDPNSIVHVTPNDSELACLYKHARCLSYLSLFEGFGIPPLEAMGYGCPVVASRAGAIPEVVGDAALLVDPNQPEAIAEAMDGLVFSDSLRDSFIQKGFEQFRRFSWKTCAEKTWEIYNSL